MAVNRKIISVSIGCNKFCSKWRYENKETTTTVQNYQMLLLISEMAGSCIAVVVIAILFETLKSYKRYQQKPCEANSETTPLIHRQKQEHTRYN